MSHFYHNGLPLWLEIVPEVVMCIERTKNLMPLVYRASKIMTLAAIGFNHHNHNPYWSVGNDTAIA